MMDSEFKIKWLQALRSGKYEQTKGRLRKLRRVGSPDLGRFCCLGVLCDLVDPQAWTEDQDPWCQAYVYQGSRNNQLLPSTLSERLGITSEVQQKLVEMNDILEYGFNDIADYVEVNL